MKKSLLSLALALVLSMGLCVPASAAFTLSGGNSVWNFSNPPTGTETVTIQQFIPGITEVWDGVILNPDVQGSYTDTQKTAYTFPLGTVITLKTPGYAASLGGPVPHDKVLISKYDSQGHLLDNSVQPIDQPMTISESDTTYSIITDVISTGENGIMSPTWGDAFYMKASDSGNTSTDSASAENTAQATVYQDEHIEITNVISIGTGQYTVDKESHPEENWPEITCNAPVEITLDMSRAKLVEYAPAASYWDAERTKVTDRKIALAQPGTYVIDYFYDEGYYQCYYVVVKSGSVAPGGGKTAFTDVAADAYYADAVKWAVEKEITTGTGDGTTFSPEITCTRAQILTFLWRAYGSPEPTVDNPFTDIKSADYYYKAALWAAEKGLVPGSTFGGDTDCTRAMTVEYLWKAAGNPTAAAQASFTDVSVGADYAQAVAWAVEKKVTIGTGDGTTFSPDLTCTRGQIVTFLQRALG